MITHNVQQGTPEWHALRREHFTASEAPAMMGESPYVTRNALLQQKVTGVVAEPDTSALIRFKQGHDAEESYRPQAEQVVGEELYPATGSIEIDGIKLLASFDGLTIDDSIVFEHKLASSANAAMMEAGELGAMYYWQLEQQLLVSGADKALFAASNGTDGKHIWYTSKPERRAALIAGWKQFAEDMKTWQPPAATDPALTGRAPEQLPALRIEITGQVTASNLAEFKQTALAAIGNVNRTLATDQDFADAEQSVKWCAEVESRLQSAKQHALSQTASIDALFSTIDDISAEARRVRLDLEKLVKARKESIRVEIVAAAKQALDSHIAALNQRLGKPYMPQIAADFASAIKGKRTIDSLQSACDSVLAAAKIEASAKADHVQASMKLLAEVDAQYASLFPDQHTLVHKQHDDLQATIQSRIAAHQEEIAKAIEREQERAQAAQAAAEAQAQKAEQAREPAQPAAAQPQPQPQPAPSQPPTLLIGEICARLGFTVTSDFLRKFGIEPASIDRGARLYHEIDFHSICIALVHHINKVSENNKPCQ